MLKCDVSEYLFADLMNRAMFLIDLFADLMNRAMFLIDLFADMMD
jgi:hypothetical protein